MTYKTYKNFEKGLGMVEIIIVIAVILVAFTAILQLLQFEAQTERLRREELRAYALVTEYLEAVRAVRDDGWTNISGLSTSVDYYAQISSGAWEITTIDPGPTDSYSRWFVIDSVNRDLNDDIVSTGGTLDLDTLRVTAHIEWESAGTTTARDITTYLTNWQEKL